MPKVILQISYEVKADKREEYLALAGEMKRHFAGDRGKNYTVFEVKGKRNTFTEEFVSATSEEFEKLEDDMNESSEQLVNRLESLIDGKARYTTLVEVE